MPDHRILTDEEIRKTHDGLSARREFFAQFCHDAGIHDDTKMVVVGDMTETLILEMTAKTVREMLAQILGMPQGVWIITQDYRWCFNQRMSETLFYGKAIGG